MGSPTFSASPSCMGARATGCKRCFQPRLHGDLQRRVVWRLDEAVLKSGVNEPKMQPVGGALKPKTAPDQGLDSRFQPPSPHQPCPRHTNLFRSRVRWHCYSPFSPLARWHHQPSWLWFAATGKKNCEALGHRPTRPSRPGLSFAVPGQRGTKGRLIEHGERPLPSPLPPCLTGGQMATADSRPHPFWW